MGSNMNFKNFGNEPPADSSGSGGPPENFPLTRQTSIYSLTFDELMNTMGGASKDFGSMNMDELLKNIWTAEEIQTMAPMSDGQQGGNATGGHLQRQGSLTLPRTLSQKTVDEVWKDIYKEYGVGREGSGTGGPNLPRRQQTLGEITLEEFLARAGVVREDPHFAGKPYGAAFGDLSRSVNNSGLDMGFQQLNKSTGLMGNRVPGSNDQIAIQPSTNLPLNVNGVRPNHQQLSHSQLPQHQQQIFPKQPGMAYATQMPLPSSAQLGSSGIRGGIAGLADQSLNSCFIQGSALQGGGKGVVGLGLGTVNVATGSPTNHLSSDGIGKSNGDTSSVSPVPYVFNGGLRGRKRSGAVEKVVERRQRRMIKNRESAARSRARKQIMEQNGNVVAI